MPPLLRELLRPYRRILAIILAATLVSMAMSLAAPWPLKIILDNVVASHRLPDRLPALLPMVGGTTKAHIAAAAGIVTVVIAVVSGAAFYVASYSTERLGSASETICACGCITTCRNFPSPITTPTGSAPSSAPSQLTFRRSRASRRPSTLNIFTDALTLVAMIVVMFWLRSDFALIALAVTPLLILFFVRVNKAIRTAVKEVRTSPVRSARHAAGGPSVDRGGAGLSREDYEDRQLRKVSWETVTAWLKTRRLSALLSPVVSLVIAVCTGLVLWRGALLILAGTMTAGALTVFLAYLARFFQPVRALSQMTDTIAQVSVGFQRLPRCVTPTS